MPDPLHIIKPETKKGEDPIFCHRFMIPFPAVEQANVPGLGVQTKDVSRMNFVPCVKERCTLWNAEKKLCGDVVKIQELARIAQAMEDDASSAEVE